jgi:Homeodomain-like domain
MQLRSRAEMHPQSGVPVMDDNLCRQFFVDPTQPSHRRYLALRAFFVDNQPYDAIAEQFGVTYHTVRSWVRDFRAQCQAGRTPPFSSNRAWAGRSATLGPRRTPSKQTALPRPTAGP